MDNEFTSTVLLLRRLADRIESHSGTGLAITTSQRRPTRICSDRIVQDIEEVVDITIAFDFIDQPKTCTVEEDARYTPRNRPEE